MYRGGSRCPINFGASCVGTFCFRNILFQGHSATISEVGGCILIEDDDNFKDEDKTMNIRLKSTGRTLSFLPALVLAPLILPSMAWADNLVFCGQAEAAGAHMVAGICIIAGGAFIQGSATEDVGSSHDFIISTFKISNLGNAVESGVAIVAQNNYTFVGEGLLATAYAGSWNGTFPNGSEFVDFSSVATSFSNSPTVAPTTTVPAGFFLGGGYPVSGSAVNNGDYSGSGQLIQFINYSLNAGDSFTFPADSLAAVPEPGTLPVFVLASLALLWAWRRSAAGSMAAQADRSSICSL
jgi:hypothetical protein